MEFSLIQDIFAHFEIGKTDLKKYIATKSFNSYEYFNKRVLDFVETSIKKADPIQVFPETTQENVDELKRELEYDYVDSYGFKRRKVLKERQPETKITKPNTFDFQTLFEDDDNPDYLFDYSRVVGKKFKKTKDIDVPEIPEQEIPMEIGQELEPEPEPEQIPMEIEPESEPESEPEPEPIPGPSGLHHPIPSGSRNQEPNLVVDSDDDSYNPLAIKPENIDPNYYVTSDTDVVDSNASPTSPSSNDDSYNPLAINPENADPNYYVTSNTDVVDPDASSDSD